MRIYRAHSQSSIEIIREEEKKLSIHIVKMIQPYQLINLPESTTFSFIGLKICFTEKQQEGFAGWCHTPCLKNLSNSNFFHIFIKEGYEKHAFIHEVAHVVDARLGFPSENLFKPELALTDYGTTNSHEYFAEAFKQFFDPVEKEELFEADKNIFYFIRATIKVATQ